MALPPMFIDDEAIWPGDLKAVLESSISVLRAFHEEQRALRANALPW
ncbi:hypothetical protein [Mesorhizobium sp.]|nr:hypothetical protein [Mesorhizobium sp.]